MGLDAIVMCGCLTAGLARPAPVPVRFDPVEGLVVPVSDDDFGEAFYTWLHTACAHPDMRLIREHVSNWPGVRLFQEALARDARAYPTLIAEVPDGNGGLTPAAAAAGALEEIAAFRASPATRSRAVLVDEHGHVLQEHVAAYDGVFILSGGSGMRAGLTSEGVFFVEDDEGLRAFESTDFKQEVVKTATTVSRAVYALTDLSTGRSLVSPIAVVRYFFPDGAIRASEAVPLRVRAEVNTEGADAFDYILVPLERLFRTSVDADLPVYWC